MPLGSTQRARLNSRLLPCFLHAPTSLYSGGGEHGMQLQFVPYVQISTYFFNAHVRSHALHVIHTASSLPYTLLLPTQDLDMEMKSGYEYSFS